VTYDSHAHLAETLPDGALALCQAKQAQVTFPTAVADPVARLAALIHAPSLG